MNKVWKRRLLRIFGAVVLLVVVIVLVNPLPKFIRYQINKSVSDLNITGIEVSNIQDLMVEEIPIRIYNSDSTEKPCILYIPGGAFIAGDLDTHDNIARYLAEELKVVVVSLDYRKAPENKYPKGLNDSEEILIWLMNNTNKYFINKSKILLVGDSAGANFCAVLSQKHKNKIAGQVLINPVLDLTENGPAYKNLDMFVKWYLNDMTESTNVDVSPLLSDSFQGLPPTVIVTCENDPLKTDGALYKLELEQDSVTVVLKNFQDFGHLANLWAGTAEETDKIRQFVVREIKGVMI